MDRDQVNLQIETRRTIIHRKKNCWIFSSDSTQKLRELTFTVWTTIVIYEGNKFKQKHFIQTSIADNLLWTNMFSSFRQESALFSLTKQGNHLQ